MLQCWNGLLCSKVRFRRLSISPVQQTQETIFQALYPRQIDPLFSTMPSGRNAVSYNDDEESFHDVLEEHGQKMELAGRNLEGDAHWNAIRKCLESQNVKDLDRIMQRLPLGYEFITSFGFEDFGEAVRNLGMDYASRELKRVWSRIIRNYKLPEVIYVELEHRQEACACEWEIPCALTSDDEALDAAFWEQDRDLSPTVSAIRTHTALVQTHIVIVFGSLRHYSMRIAWSLSHEQWVLLYDPDTQVDIDGIVAASDERHTTFCGETVSMAVCSEDPFTEYTKFTLVEQVGYDIGSVTKANKTPCWEITL